MSITKDGKMPTSHDVTRPDVVGHVVHVHRVFGSASAMTKIPKSTSVWVTMVTMGVECNTNYSIGKNMCVYIYIIYIYDITFYRLYTYLCIVM